MIIIIIIIIIFIIRKLHHRIDRKSRVCIDKANNEVVSMQLFMGFSSAIHIVLV